MRVPISTAGVILTFLVLPSTARSQACATPECEDPWITELRLGRFFGFSGDDRSPFLVTVHAGYLTPRGADDAIGGGLIFGANDIDGFAGIEGRYRHRLARDRTLDVGLGLVPFAGESLGTPVVMADVGLSQGRLGGFLHIQTLKDLNPLTDEFRETEIVAALVGQLSGDLGKTAAMVLLAVAGFLWLSFAA